MILKSLKLDNIRSYENQTIEFPQSSVLLSGDVGAGKSTILLAVEFALFGLRRPDIPGSALLRHGTNEAEVQLRFELNKKEIIIARKLKRSSTGIKQESGYIIIDDVKTDATHVELKSKVLQLLGYPEEMLTKTKSLIYRYTVYTPQEEMKHILFSDEQERLNTLRRVFDIDKYKRIRENASLYSRELRRVIAHMQGQLEELPRLQAQFADKKQRLVDLHDQLAKKNPEIESINLQIKELTEQIEISQKKLDEFAHSNKDYELQNVKQQNVVNQIAQNKKELLELTKQIETLEIKPIQLIEVDTTKAKRKEVVQKIEDLNKQQQQTNTLIAQAQTKIDLSEKTLQGITELDNCPTCLQIVNDDHKNQIRKKENEIQIDQKKQVQENQLKQKSAATQMQELNLQLQRLDKQLSEDQLNKMKIENIKEKKSKILQLEESNKSLKSEMASINKAKIQLHEKLQEYEPLKQKHKQLCMQSEEFNSKHRQLELSYNSIQKELEFETNANDLLKKRIDEKSEVKQKLGTVQKTEGWLTDFFTNLMTNMEKHVMLTIHHEFNSLVSKWFDILIEDEGLGLRLDDQFTPIIIQNGYETALQNLSGGEKTAVALAYRLALNRVINDLVSTIKTKGLLILDEPTDGFSTEQLDRVKEVIDQLESKQLIVVSHEPKIEAFVDNIIRIQKDGHKSTANYI